MQNKINSGCWPENMKTAKQVGAGIRATTLQCYEAGIPAESIVAGLLGRNGLYRTVDEFARLKVTFPFLADVRVVTKEMESGEMAIFVNSVYHHEETYDALVGFMDLVYPVPLNSAAPKKQATKKATKKAKQESKAVVASACPFA